jgi:hypothetical protein
MRRTAITRRSYSTGGVPPVYLGSGLPSQIANLVTNAKQCKELNTQKNNLLNSLKDYFTRKIEKEALKSQLVTIKSSIQTGCGNC